ncbi:MAG: NHL repeat-containing protein [Thermodesulfobacteriota bacterium]
MRLLILTVLAAALLLPARAGLCRQGERVRHLASITARDTQIQGVLGGAFYDQARDRLYVTDVAGGRILAFDAEHRFVSDFAAGGALKEPAGLVRDGRDRFFVAEPGKGRVLVVDMAAKTVADLDLSSARKGNPVYPGRLALDREGRLYLADRANQRVLVFNPDLDLVRELPVSGRGLRDVQVDDAGRVYALDALECLVRVLEPDGRQIRTLGRRGPGRGELLFPSALAVDPRGVVYVADARRDKVLKYGPDGSFLSEFSQSGWLEGRLRGPSALCLDREGRIYVVDQMNARISIFR